MSSSQIEPSLMTSKVTASTASIVKSYEQAVTEGYYKRDVGGLSGKYDNVRRYWEDQITCSCLLKFIEKLLDNKDGSQGLKILDLGSGSGEGYKLLTSIKKNTKILSSNKRKVFKDSDLASYTGVDISPAMVKEGDTIYKSNPKINFLTSDLSEGLKNMDIKDKYDIYFSSYGSLSHLKDGQLELLVNDIIDNSDSSFIFVADLIGRYSFEWQCYWEQSGTDETNMRQYSMSYLYPEEMLDKIEVERFPLRYWGGQEFSGFMDNIARRKGITITNKLLQDRSVLVGRHMNTKEFNPNTQPIRDAVNGLFEFDYVTDLTKLLFRYKNHDKYPELNRFFENFTYGWNSIINATIDALEHWDDKEFLQNDAPQKHSKLVRDSINTMKNIILNAKCYWMDDPRANVIEPQLGYVLKFYEEKMQQGIGASHGLLAVFQIEK